MQKDVHARRVRRVKSAMPYTMRAAHVQRLSGLISLHANVLCLGSTL